MSEEYCEEHITGDYTLKSDCVECLRIELSKKTAELDKKEELVNQPTVAEILTPKR